MASSKKVNVLPKVLPQAAKLPRTSGFFQKNNHISAKESASGSEAARDKWLVQKEVGLLRKGSAPGSEAARDKWLLQKSQISEKKVLPQAAKLPGTSGFLKKNQCSAKSSAPGSEAARDKWLLQKE